MKTFLLSFFCFLTILLSSSFCDGQTLYWIAASPSNWNNMANWSTTSGGFISCSCIPGISNIVVFDGAGGANGTCTLDVPSSIGAIQLNGYSGTIDLSGNDLIIGGVAANNIFNSGTVIGPGDITITATSNVSFAGTYLGSGANLNATLTTATGIFTGGTGTTFDGSVTVSAYSILLNGSRYNETTTLTKTGDVNDAGAGGNAFNGTTTIINTSNRILRTASTTGDSFNGSLEVIENSNTLLSKIQLAYGSGTITSFNGNIQVNSANNSSNVGGISFGESGGTSLLASGFTLTEGGTGFLRGTLDIRNFTQLGNTAQGIDLSWTDVASGSALTLVVTNSTFNGNVTFTASNLNLGGNNVFNGVSNTFIKATGGSSTTNVAGNNTFNQAGSGGSTTFRNNTTSTVSLASSIGGDTFNGNVTFNISTSAGQIRVAQTGTSFFLGNITLTYVHASPIMPVLFGTAEFSGTAAQNISNNRSLLPQFSVLRMNKTSENLQLNAPVTVVSTLNLTSGKIFSTSTNYISLLNNSTAINANNASYVDGPIRKIGDDAFTFPVGDDNYYRPIAISAPATTTSEFSAQYFYVNHGLGTTADPAIVSVSMCEYWALDRLADMQDVLVTLSWNPSTYCNNPDYITNPANLAVVHWNGTLWADHGNGGITGDETTEGTVVSFASVTNFGAFTLGSTALENPLPVELLSKEISIKNDGAEIIWKTASEVENNYFTIERSDDGYEFKSLAIVKGAGTTNEAHHYSWIDIAPLPGRSYYRLRQTDYDGLEKDLGILLLINEYAEPIIYPNPVRTSILLDRLNSDEFSTIVITDMMGRIVPSKRIKNLINVEHLSSGTYLLSVILPGRIISFRFTKE